MSRLTLFIVILGCLGLSFCAQQQQQHSQFPWDYANASSMANDYGEVAVAQDSKDIVSLSSGEAGPQYHFRVSRAYCDRTSGSPQSASDQANFFCVPDAVTIDASHPPSTTPNKDYLIAPYKYGMAVEYPGVLETSAKDFSVHNEHKLCSTTTIYLDPYSCNASAHFWVGDVDDYGGLYAAAYDVLGGDQASIDPTRSFVLLASDTFGHTSHGDMLFALRNQPDNFRFQFGYSGAGGADDPATYKTYTRARIDSTGKGFFDGGTQTGGADFAESVGTAAPKAKYEPGDVLVIDTRADRRFALSSAPYSTLVAGVYSTKPGVTGSEHTSEDPKLAAEIPMAVVGIVPCNVSAENGAISRGDLLVTSSTRGYAMRGSDAAKLTGAVIGKALQPLASGKGKIEVLVTLR
ncbi:MAG: hypothetical protein WAN14_04230 [Candidatus Acidiferrales bacterium]